MNVTFEAVKEQLDALGHAVPDDVVRAFLADINQQPAHEADGTKAPQAYVPVLGDRGQRSAGRDSPGLPEMGKKDIEHVKPAEFTRCHRFTATASSTTTTTLRPSPPARAPATRPATRPSTAKAHGHPATTPFSTTRASSSARKSGGHCPASRGADAPGTLDSVTARAEALLAAHDAHRASILREDFAGASVSERRQTAQKQPPPQQQRSARKAMPVSSRWGLRDESGDGDDPSDHLPAAMAPQPQRRGAPASTSGSEAEQEERSDSEASASSDDDESDDALSRRGLRRGTSGTGSIFQPPLLPEATLPERRSVVSRSQLSGGARRVDRVARYQQLQQQWKRDSFLQHASGKPRKNMGFQKAFAAAHEATRRDLDDFKHDAPW